jgi:hypothetical protein
MLNLLKLKDISVENPDASWKAWFEKRFTRRFMRQQRKGKTLKTNEWDRECFQILGWKKREV